MRLYFSTKSAYLQPTDDTYICSAHFTKEDFRWTPVRKCLKNTAVPSVFEWSTASEPRRKIVKHESQKYIFLLIFFNTLI